MKMDKPDGCLAWGVACSAFLINLIVVGITRSSSILYVAIIDIFGISRGLAMTPFSICTSTGFLFGPVVGILGQRYGVRAVAIAGGIFGTVGSISCFFAHDIKWLICTWGVIAAIGFALANTLVQLIVGPYFKKYRTTASGFIVSGGSIGGVLCPMLVQYSLYQYGLHGTFFIIAGVILHIISGSIILKKPPWMRTRNYNQPTISMNEKSMNLFTVDISDKVNGTDKKNSNLKERVVTKGNQGKNLNLTKLKILELKDGIYIGSTEIPFLGNESLFSNTLFEAIKFLRSVQEHKREDSMKFCDNHIRPSKAIVQDFLYKLYECVGDQHNIIDYEPTSAQVQCSSNELQDSYYKDTIESELEEFKKDQVATRFFHYLQNMDSELFSFPIAEKMLIIISQIVEKLESFKLLQLQNVNSDESTTVETNDKTSLPIIKLGFTDHIKTALKLNLNPVYSLLCVCQTMHFICFMSLFTILIDFTMDKGLQEDDGKFVVSALSMGDLVGRLGLGWITDRDYITLPRFMLSVMVIQGAITVALPWIYNKWVLLCTVTLFGALQGSLFVRHPILILKYLSPHEHSIAMGSINFLPGLLGFGLPAFVGYFRDTLGSYNHVFHITGTIDAFIGLLWIFEPYFRRDQPKIIISKQEK